MSALEFESVTAVLLLKPVLSEGLSCLLLAACSPQDLMQRSLELLGGSGKGLTVKSIRASIKIYDDDGLDEDTIQAWEADQRNSGHTTPSLIHGVSYDLDDMDDHGMGIEAAGALEVTQLEEETY